MVSTLPVKMAVSPMTLADCAEMPYSPAVLLDSKFDASVTDDPLFRGACESDFDAYFNRMYAWDASRQETVFVEKSYSWEEVAAFVAENVSAEEGDNLRHRGWRAGFLLGWLSALALTSRSEAQQGLALLELLLALPASLAEPPAKALPVRVGYRLPARAVGMDGWPLDW